MHVYMCGYVYMYIKTQQCANIDKPVQASLAVLQWTLEQLSDLAIETLDIMTETNYIGNGDLMHLLNSFSRASMLRQV